jgi:hypothetical protein
MLSKTDLAIADVEFPKRSQLIMGDRPNLTSCSLANDILFTIADDTRRERV